MASPSKRKKSIKDSLSCPVCEELLVAPAFGCQNGHLICASCKSKIPHCSVCRAERFNVRNLTVEELLALPVLTCKNQKAGCIQPLMTGQEYTAHNKVCSFRPVECESKSGISSCQNQVVPYNFYLEHLKAFHGATKINKKSFLVSCDMDGSFTPKYFEAYNRTFILQCHHNQNSLWTWVASLTNDVHSQKFFVKLRLRYKVKNQQLQSFVSDVFPPSNVRELNSEVLKSGRCLELKSDSCPPFVWPNYIAVEDEERVSWGYDVEIWEESAYHHSVDAMSKLIFENSIPENTVHIKSNQQDPPKVTPPVNSDATQNGVIQNPINVIQSLTNNLNNMMNATAYAAEDSDDYEDDGEGSFDSSYDEMEDLSANLPPITPGDSKIGVPGVIMNPMNDEVLMELGGLLPIKFDGDEEQQQEQEGEEKQQQEQEGEEKQQQEQEGEEKQQEEQEGEEKQQQQEEGEEKQQQQEEEEQEEEKQQQQESGENENQVKLDDESIMNKQELDLNSDSSVMNSDPVSLDSSSRSVVIKRSSPVKDSNGDDIIDEEEPLAKRMKIEGMAKESEEEKEQAMEKVENEKSEIDSPSSSSNENGIDNGQAVAQNAPISENSTGQ